MVFDLLLLLYHSENNLYPRSKHTILIISQYRMQTVDQVGKVHTRYKVQSTDKVQNADNVLL